MAQLTGTIIRKVADKGFGFIKDGRTGLEYFFHRTDLAPHIPFEHVDAGDAVTFDEVIPAPEKGRRAARVALK